MGTVRAADAPQQAYVGAASGQVTSGPGDAYYPVAMLPRGTAIEVHASTRDGWLAIRPPAGSFSLIRTNDLELANGKLGRVRRDGTRSRVGSTLGDRHDAMHVELPAGEVVEVLGTWSKDPQWSMIAPPAGEFRYIRASDVTSQPVPGGSDVATNTWQQRGAGSGTAVIDSAVVTAADQQPTSRYTQSLTAEAPQLQATPPEPLAAINNTATALPTAALPIATPPTATGALPNTASNPIATAATASPIDSSIDQLELSLALRVSEPINVWQLSDLESQTASLLASTKDSQQQAALRSLAERLDRFARLQQRYLATRGDAPAMPAAGVASDITPLAADGVPPVDGPAGEYDAIGILRPVVSKRAGAPPYALVDPQGKIVTFVTPSPSLNMQPLLGQRVGVSGTRGFMPEYQQRHVATARINAVDGTTRR